MAVAVVIDLAAALLSTTALPTAAQTSGGGVQGRTVTDEVVAEVADEGTAFVIANLAAPVGAPAVVLDAPRQCIDELPEGSFQGEARAQDLPFVALEVDEAGLDGLRVDPSVTSVVLNHVNTPSLVTTVPAVGGDVARGFGYDGTGTSVAIIDGGVQWYHPFLSDSAGTSRVVRESCFSGAGGAYPDNVLSLCPGGAAIEWGVAARSPAAASSATSIRSPVATAPTWPASPPARRPATTGPPQPRYGVAPKASILSANVFSLVCEGFIGTDGGCSSGFIYGAFDSDVALALNWVNGLRTTYNVAAVNVSLGGAAQTASTCDSQTVVSGPITTLRNNGVATVVASGNDGDKFAISSPACVSTAVSVGSWDPGTNSVSTFSNSSSCSPCWRPGTEQRPRGRVVGADHHPAVLGVLGGGGHVDGGSPRRRCVRLLKQTEPSTTVDDADRAAHQLRYSRDRHQRHHQAGAQDRPALRAAPTGMVSASAGPPTRARRSPSRPTSSGSPSRR